MHSKGAPIFGYPGVTRKVPFELRPKDRNEVFEGNEGGAPYGGKNPRKQRNKLWEVRAVTPFLKTQTDWVWLDLFHSFFGTDFRQLNFTGWAWQNHWLLGQNYNSKCTHASFTEVFLSLFNPFTATMSLENDQQKCEIRNPLPVSLSFSHWHGKGFPSKRITLKMDVTESQKTDCMVSVHFQPGNVTG